MTDVGFHQSDKGPAIIVTAAAEAHLVDYLKKQIGTQGVRLSVKKTGCSGYAYVVDYVTAPEADDLVFPLTHAYQLFVDKKSYPFLKGISIDYVRQGLNAKLVFKNPNQTGECGCGESFTIA